MHNGKANRNMPNTGGWQDRHDIAWRAAKTSPDAEKMPRDENKARQAQARALGVMLRGWQAYAVAHYAIHETRIADDGFLGPQWLEIGKGLRAMLNGETGALDCGTLDSFILVTLADAGFSEDDL